MRWSSFLVGILAVALLAGTAAAEVGTLPGGTSISVEIDAPTGGATVDPIVEVTGTASIAATSAVKDTTVVYAIDTSLSTARPAGVDCVPGTGDTILACEKEAVRRVNAAAAGALSPVANSGVARFTLVGTPLPLGSPYLVPPGPAIDAAVSGLTSAGGTSFPAGLNAAKTILGDPAVQPGKIIVFLSDGGDTALGSTLPTLPAGTIVQAFAIGGGCGTGSPSLNQVAAKGAAGSACTPVTDLSVLDDLIMESIAASLDSLALTVDNGAPVPITAVPALPVDGPQTVSYSITTGELAPGPHELCVTATGTDAGGSGSVSECVDVTVFEVSVDCATETCELTLADGNTSVANFEGFNLDKVVGMSAFGIGDAGDCGTVNCISTYEVGFADNGGVGVAELTVLMAKKFSVPPAQAKVYIDGVLLTARCTSSPSPIPCQKVTSDNAGQTKYFVRFAADPRFGFR